MESLNENNKRLFIGSFYAKNKNKGKLFTVKHFNPGLRVENYLRIESSSLLSDVVVHSSLSSTSDSDDIEIDEQNGTQHNDAIAVYLADDLQIKDNDVVYCPQLGLAIERIFTITESTINGVDCMCFAVISNPA
jgi:hypothetical protein